MSVEIKQDIRLSFDAGKFISVPDALILEHDGEQFLKVKATSASIISVITGKVAPKNGSFATSKNLQELLRLRNEADAERDASRAAGEAEDLFKNVASEPPCKKVKVQMKKPDLNEHTVSIMVKDCNVVCLMAGIRPSKSDLTVKVLRCYRLSSKCYVKILMWHWMLVGVVTRRKNPERAGWRGKK